MNLIFLLGDDPRRAVLTCSSANADRSELPPAFRGLFQRMPSSEAQRQIQRRTREKYGPLT